MTNIGIFLSYRREDSEAETRDIHNRLLNKGFRPFMDRREINPGEKWPDKIRSALRAADVVIAVIGKEWLTCQKSDGRRRIDDKDDWVHCELCLALQLGKKIIPVLIKSADMPPRENLPKELKDLALLQAQRLTGQNWPQDVEALLGVIDGSEKVLPRATLVLTSKSPRRLELLRTIGWSEGTDYFSVNASVSLNVSEERLTLDKAKHIAESTARKKIDWLCQHTTEFSQDLPSGWNPFSTIIIGVDTIVFCRDKILDRPLLKALELAGPQDLTQARVRAKAMLMEQCGQTIHIVTGLSVSLMGDHRGQETTVVATEAKLRAYSEADIDNYISCSEPFDKAGAFGIQEQGVSLFECIKGSYTNVVGLPLLEFINLLKKKYEGTFALPELKSPLAPRTEPPASVARETFEKAEGLSVVCVGDINYDFIYDRLPPSFFPNLRAPGEKIIGPIHRAVGGTAVNFAKGAVRAGFSPCYVVGVIGGDALGSQIVSELHSLDIVPIHRHDPQIETSIAIILRNDAGEDTSLTLTDAHQSLPDIALSLAQGPIEASDVLSCSGYALTDKNRQASAVKMLKAAKDARHLVVLDVVVGMSSKVELKELEDSLSGEKTRQLVDVVASEMPEIFNWFNVSGDGKDELDVWALHQEVLIKRLREHFSVAILRTSHYTHEVVITPHRVEGPTVLDYRTRPVREKTGYGDLRTAKQIHSFLSPRIVLASKSPQRRKLLSQLVAPSKIQVVFSTCAEEGRQHETPDERVTRLAGEKAESVFRSGNYHDDIELIIGADTEIVRERGDGFRELIGHPADAEEALRHLRQLNDANHYALTGIAIIGKDSKAGRARKVTAVEQTKVRFINASDEQLTTYAHSGEPIGRAGAYAIQGLGTVLVQSIEGSYSNIVGLPLERLSQVLEKEFDKAIWDFDKVSKWSFPDPIKGFRNDRL